MGCFTNAGGAVFGLNRGIRCEDISQHKLIFIIHGLFVIDDFSSIVNLMGG